jgi:hypothetical protein
MTGRLPPSPAKVTPHLPQLRDARARDVNARQPALSSSALVVY